MAKEDFGGFLGSWSDELTAQSQRVRDLIGDVHWLSDGNHKEAILRSFLRRYMPSTLTVATGFAINPAHSLRITRQQDILICDLRDQAPFLAQEDFYIVPSTSVTATMEVKSTLSSAVLQEALGNILQSGCVLSGQQHAPWQGAVFFSSEAVDHAQFARWMNGALKRSWPDHPSPNGAPICIISVGHFVAFLDIARLRLRVLPTGDKSLAFGLLDIISAFRSRSGQGAESQFDIMAMAEFNGNPSIFTIDDPESTQ